MIKMHGKTIALRVLILHLDLQKKIKFNKIQKFNIYNFLVFS
jgi:hypothetical protein